jgi:hypothetical protein
MKNNQTSRMAGGGGAGGALLAVVTWAKNMKRGTRIYVEKLKEKGRKRKDKRKF